MSTASISYGSLKDAAGEAKDVAKKLDKYADSINSSVYKKLNNYDGSWTSNITTARSKANAKIVALRDEAGRYRTYADNLQDLKTECDTVDKAVKSKVSSLTASFKESHGIKNNVVVNTISYFFTSITNSSSAGRWVSAQTDAFEADTAYIKQAIEDWYDYEGGKQLIKGVTIGVLEVVVGVLSIFAALASGAAFIVVLAGVVAGVIAVVNGFMNIGNEARGYSYTQNDDPATGRRKSDLDTVQDTLRVETDSKFWHGVAGGIDIVNTVCTVITVVNSLGKLGSGLTKWATGGSDTSWKGIFTKDFWHGMSSNFKDIGAGFKSGGMGYVKDLFKLTIDQAKVNLSNEFWDFGTQKDSFNTLKHIFSVPLDLLKDGFLKTFGHDLLLPAITLIPDVGSTDNKTFGDLEGIISKTIKVFNSGDSDSSIVLPSIDADLKIKLNIRSDINISIGEIRLPDINMPVIAAA